MARLKSLVVIPFIAFLLMLCQNATAINILAIVSMPLRSHYVAFEMLFRELALRGHYVTVINNFPDSDPVPNLRFIDLQGQNLPATGMPTLVSFENTSSRYEHLRNIHRHVHSAPEIMRVDCERLLMSENAKAHLAERNKYDVIFVEQFMSDCGLAYAAAFYDAPIIGITSHVMLPWSYPRLGLLFDFSADAFYFSNSGPNPSLYYKIETLLMNLYFFYGKWIIQRNIYDVFKLYVPHVSVDIEDMARKQMKMMFVYQHYSVTGARVLAPQLLEIGGIHIGQLKPLPKTIEDFLTNATHGAIYVSFGSNLVANTMSPNKLQEFLKAFKQIPQKVIWKLENVTLPAGNDNIYTSNWLPQLDILCHPKVVAFVSHGGMLSLSEAAHCGKPLIAIPFFGDQFSNAAAVEASGLGTKMFFSELNADNLAREIKKLASNEMYLKAQKVSKAWHDRPQSVMDSAIFWTEYVARHRNGPPSLPSKGKTLFESLLLDVYCILALILFFVFSICYLIFKIFDFIRVKLLQGLTCVKKSKKD